MIPTLAITTIIQKWRDVLYADPAIYAYCLAQYGRPPTIYVGVPRISPPTAANCPYIVIRPGSKVEGTAHAENAYAVAVGWSILADDIGSTTTVHALPVPGNEEPPETYNVSVIENSAVYEADALGQLILAAIDGASGDNPISTADYELEVVDFLPQVVGDVQIEIGIASVHAGALSY